MKIFQEILSEQSKPEPYGQFYLDEYGKKVIIDKYSKSAGIYSRFVAIEFAEWLGNNCYRTIHDKWCLVGSVDRFTTEELYEIFINKDNTK